MERARLARTAFFGAALSATLLTALGVVVLHQYGEDRRDAVVILTRVQDQTEQEAYISRLGPQQAITGEQVADESAISRDMDSDLSKLPELGMDPATIQALNRSNADVRTALDRVSANLSRGDPAAATVLDRTQAYPALDGMRTLVASVINVQDAAADQAAMLSTVGSAGLVVSAGLAMTLLFTGAQRRRRWRDIVEGERRALEASAQRFRSLVQHSFDVIGVVGSDETMTSVSAAALGTFGRSPQDMEGTPLADWVHPEDLPRVRTLIEQAVSGAVGVGLLDCRLRRDDGSWWYAEVAITSLVDDPYVGGVVLNIRDITDRRNLEAQLTHRAFHDELTGLANRALFDDRLRNATIRAERSGTPVTVLLLDLDGFKAVNDSLGHLLGDALLCGVAGRVSGCVRPGDTVARLGGDEFALVLEGADAAEGELVAERLTEALREPFTFGGLDMLTSASVGVATAEGARSDPDGLMRSADAAMYAAKASGKNRHAVFDPTMHGRILRLQGLRAELRRAVQRNDFLLMYQPIVDVETGAIVSVEALLRWRHPARGLVSPLDFVPLAEETGMIVSIGSWVLREAVNQVARWPTGPAGPLTLSINVSARQLQAGFADEVQTVLAEVGLEPNRLIVEVTESVLVGDDSQAMVAELRALRALGVQLAIDDFGTGYSSLGYLRKLPRDIVKIDRTFVSDAPAAEDAPFMRALVNLLRTLDVRIVAEGIETAEQLDYVRSLGCHLAQGFFMHRPMEAASVIRILGGSESDGAPVLAAAT